MWKEAKIEECRSLARQKRGSIQLPSHVSTRAKALTKRPDLEDKVLLMFEKWREKCLPVNFFWFRTTYNKVFKEADEIIPSDGKIHAALKRADITLQSIRDHKSKTVREVRKQLIRLDRVQRSPGRNPRDPTYGRFSPEHIFAFDEPSGVMFPKTKKTYNFKGYASCHARVPNNLDTRQMSCCPIFTFGKEQLEKVAVILPLAPAVSTKDNRGRPLT